MYYKNCNYFLNKAAFFIKKSFCQYFELQWPARYYVKIYWVRTPLPQSTMPSHAR